MKLNIKESNEDFEVVKRFQVSYIEGDNPYDDSAQVYDNGGGFEIVKDPETGLYGWQSDAMDESSDVRFNSFDDAYNDAVEVHNSDDGILMVDGEVVGDFDEVDDSDDSDDSDDFDYSVMVAKEKAMHYQPEDVSPEGVFLYDGKKARTDRIKYEIVKLIIKPGIEEIDEGPFNNLPRLESVKIPKTVKRIRSYSFFNCPNLKSIIIPDSVTRIDGYVFVRCPNLKKVVIPNSVTHLGSDIFFGNDQDITVYTDSKYVKDYCLEQEENITVKPLHQF